MAAAATTNKPQLEQINTLKTPLSATYPSELKSPMVGTPTFIKREDSQKTPITPPAAYLDFLKTLSPTLISPQSTGTRFSFGERPTPISQASTDSLSTTASLNSHASCTRTSRPATKDTNPAADSSKPNSRSSSRSSCHFDTQHAKPTQMKITIPNAGNFAPPPSGPLSGRPHSARTPRGLHHPNSPYSPHAIRSPRSAASIYSPYSATSSTMSPRDWTADGENKTTAVRVKQVVTRTVTYTRGPTVSVQEVPASKKRKIDS